MSEPAQKCKDNAIFKQNYTLTLVIAFKWPILVFQSTGKSRFS